MVLIIICRTDSNGHGTAQSKHEGAGDFREVIFGRLVRRGWTELPSSVPESSSRSS